MKVVKARKGYVLGLSRGMLAGMTALGQKRTFQHFNRYPLYSKSGHVSAFETSVFSRAQISPAIGSRI